MQPAEHRKMYDAETHHFWFVGTRTVMLTMLERALGERLHGARLLDVGCGTGYTLTRLPIDVQVVGLDLAPTALHFAAQRAPYASLVRASAYGIPFADESFDVVLALDVLEHLDDDLDAAAELARVLRPDGVAVIAVPAFQWLWSGHDVALEHRRRYRLAELETVLTAAGLTIDHASYYNTLLFPLVAAKRMVERWLLGGGKVESDLSLPPELINVPLGAVLGVERHLVPHMKMPFGVSCFAVARKR